MQSAGQSMHERDAAAHPSSKDKETFVTLHAANSKDGSSSPLSHMRALPERRLPGRVFVVRRMSVSRPKRRKSVSRRESLDNRHQLKTVSGSSSLTELTDSYETVDSSSEDPSMDRIEGLSAADINNIKHMLPITQKKAKKAPKVFSPKKERLGFRHSFSDWHSSGRFREKPLPAIPILQWQERPLPPRPAPNQRKKRLDPAYPPPPNKKVNSDVQLSTVHFPAPPRCALPKTSRPRRSYQGLKTILETPSITSDRRQSAKLSIFGRHTAPAELRSSTTPNNAGNERKRTSFLQSALQYGLKIRQKEKEELPPIPMKSTPFSATAPLFRHGTIRIDKRLESASSRGDGAARRSSTTLPAEVDWTAFQLAISGGTGDLLMGDSGVDTSLDDTEELEREIVDLVGWWEGFGFPDPQSAAGQVVTKHARERISIPSVRYRPDSVLPPGPVELPAEPARMVQPSNVRRRHGRKVSDLSNADSGIGDGYESDYSLPDSPMDEISLDRVEQPGSLVLMGYNLHHDLAGFLKWEHENVEGVV